MPQHLMEVPICSRVANRGLRARIVAAMEALGEIEGTEAVAVAAFGWPQSVRRRRLVRILDPSASQASSVRRALARLRSDRIIVDAGRRRRRKTYRLRRDAELLASLTLADGFHER